MGIFFIIKLIITIINTGFNFAILHETFGWSAKMLAGIFSNITHYLLHQNHKEKQEINKTQLTDIANNLKQIKKPVTRKHSI